jgi:hypothetical protein
VQICAEIESSCLRQNFQHNFYFTFPQPFLFIYFSSSQLCHFTLVWWKQKNENFHHRENKKAKEISLSSHQNHPITLERKFFFTFHSPSTFRCLVGVKKFENFCFLLKLRVYRKCFTPSGIFWITRRREHIQIAPQISFSSISINIIVIISKKHSKNVNFMKNLNYLPSLEQ